jgi:serine/threonine protein phosphatase PrpC
VFDHSPSSEPTALAAGALRCPRCGATGAPGDAFCEVDGARLVGGGAAAASSMGSGGCPCGAALDDGDGYCARCGHRLAPAASLLPDHADLEVAPDLAATTDRGRRHPRNEDAVALAREDVGGAPALILVVCDGVSSSRDGDRAAALAVRATCDALLAFARQTERGESSGALEAAPPTGPREDPMQADPAARAAMADAIHAAHAAVCTLEVDGAAGGDPPSTTVVAVLALRGRVTVGWVGDSRAYWVGADDARLLSHDHSWVNEVVDGGAMDAAAAMRDPRAHALTHCLGPLEQACEGAAPEPAVASFAPPPGGRLVLCSDGLWNYVPAVAELAALARAVPAEASAQVVARALVDHALVRGGHDNVTVAVACLL